MRLFAAAAVLALLSGCASLGPPPTPTDLDHGLLIVGGRVRGALLPFTSDVLEGAVAEQLGPDGEQVPGRIVASRSNGPQDVYFLDLPPGRYSLTSVSFRARGARDVVELSTTAMRPEAVDLRAGAAAFLGELSLDGKFPDFDVAVERAATVAGHWLTFFLSRPSIPRDAELRKIDRSPEAERRALLAARAELSGTQWRSLVSARLREIGSAEPAATAGGLRNRELPLQPADFFSWRDTLKWGKPARGATGLAWSRPGGEAKIAVFFTTAAAPGFAGYEEAVRQMRVSAGGLDDTAALYEVRVGTRTGQAARTTAYRYPASTLVGSEVAVTTTETVLIPDAAGMFTARLRAPRGEFEKAVPAFREFLLQLVLGPPAPPAPVSDPELP
jgi:hypothetical protein